MAFYSQIKFISGDDNTNYGYIKIYDKNNNLILSFDFLRNDTVFLEPINEFVVIKYNNHLAAWFLNFFFRA